jgi:hypothetical protein
MLVGHQLTAEERDRIAGLVREVESASTTHDVHRLKTANQALDNGTQHLATLLIDRAMAEAAKRKR